MAAVVGADSFDSLTGAPVKHAAALLVLLNRTGRNLAQKRNTWGAGWTVLTREHLFTTVEGQDEYPLPADFLGFVDGSVWDRSTYREARGVLSPQQWQQVKSGLVESAVITPFYRLRRSSDGRGRAFFLDPVPAGGDLLVFEYLGGNWVSDVDNSTFRDAITEDTDIPLFDGDLVEMGTLWRFKQARGLSYAAELGEFENQESIRFADDAGARKITIGRQRGRRYFANIPDGNWPGV